MAACYQPPGRDTQSKQHYRDSFCSALTALSNSHLLLAAADFNDLSPQRPSQRQSCLSRVLTCFGLQHLICEPTPRASLKPMQPMHLHWAPRFWGPRHGVWIDYWVWTSSCVAKQSDCHNSFIQICVNWRNFIQTWVKQDTIIKIWWNQQHLIKNGKFGQKICASPKLCTSANLGAELQSNVCTVVANT